MTETPQPETPQDVIRVVPNRVDVVNLGTVDDPVLYLAVYYTPEEAQQIVTLAKHLKKGLDTLDKEIWTWATQER